MRGASEQTRPAGAPGAGPARRAASGLRPARAWGAGPAGRLGPRPARTRGAGPARRAMSVVLASAALAAAPRAASADPAAAEALFQEGRRLLLLGNIDEACDQLGESQRLDSSSGTLLNLADCHERQGKLATAWAEFLAASRLAVIQKNAIRAAEAGRRAAVLESQLSYLTVRVAAPPPGLTVRRDGQPLHGVQLGARLPVDPGLHVIVAEAPGYEAFQTAVPVEPGGDDVRVWIPPLWAGRSGLAAPLPPPASGRPRPSGADGPRSDRPVFGYVAGGVGALSVGVGTFFGIHALAINERAEGACPTPSSCPREALDDRRRADGQAWAANVTIGAGLAGLALGAYFVFRDAPKAAPVGPATRGAPWLTAGPGALGLVGRF